MQRFDSMDMVNTKTAYYVEYLGWRQSNAFRGRRCTEPIIASLLHRAQQHTLPKLTIQVTKKEIKISSEVTDEGKSRKTIKTIKYPSISSRDITFVTQAQYSNDIVACIYLGFNPKTRRNVHVHAYRCDSAQTAAMFVRHLEAIIEIPENKKRLVKLENDLAKKGEIEIVKLSSQQSLHNDNPHSPRRNKDTDWYSNQPYQKHSSIGSNDDNDSRHNSSDGIEADMISLHEVTPVDSIMDEFKTRLNMGGAPLLLPPKDYDTIRRGHGNLDCHDVRRRKCLNPEITGFQGTIPESNGEKLSSTGSSDPKSLANEADEGVDSLIRSSLTESEETVIYQGLHAPGEDRVNDNADRSNQLHPTKDLNNSFSGSGGKLSRTHSSSSKHSNPQSSPPVQKPFSFQKNVSPHNTYASRVSDEPRFGRPSGDSYATSPGDRVSDEPKFGRPEDLFPRSLAREPPKLSPQSSTSDYSPYRPEYWSTSTNREPIVDYDDETVVMRHRPGSSNRSNLDLTHSVPEDMLRREKDASDAYYRAGPHPAQFRHSSKEPSRQSDNMYLSRPGDYGMRRATSMYR